MEDIKDIQDIFKKTERLLKDEYYFRHIFKKTEKICEAVFYITANIDHTPTVESVRSEAVALLEYVTQSLLHTRADVTHFEDELALHIISLETKLGLATAEGVLRREHHAVFITEIDTLTRALRSYQTPRTLVRARQTQERIKEPTSQSESAQTNVSNRASKILRILKETESASLKDIAHEFTDVSNKTIQRELMSLTAEGKVRKEGDKRWARYSLV